MKSGAIIVTAPSAISSTAISASKSTTASSTISGPKTVSSTTKSTTSKTSSIATAVGLTRGGPGEPILTNINMTATKFGAVQLLDRILGVRNSLKQYDPRTSRSPVGTNVDI